MRSNRSLLKIFAVICCVAFAFALSACNEKNEEGNISSNPYAIVYKDIKIELDKPAKNVLDALGASKYSDNLGDCGGIGVQMKYTYEDITVNTLKEKDGEVIHKISFLNDLVSTSKGISLGASESEVRDAYGTPSSEENGKLIYKQNNLELEFTIKNGSVSAINYRRIV